MANDRSFRIALIYFIFAVLWITLSDRIDFLEFDYEYYQTIKGLFFVTASSVLIYVALRIEARHRRKVERAHAIVASRERLLISELGASLWQWNGRTNTTRFTEESKRLIGEDASFPISVEAWLARIHPDDIGAVRTAIADVVAGRSELFQTDYRIRHRLGHWVWIHSSAVPQRDASGRLAYLIGIDFDVTPLKQSQTLLEESEALYRTLFEKSPDAIIMLDPETLLPIAFNQRACDQLKYSADELSHRALHTYVIDRTEEQVRGRIASVLKDGEADFETKLRRKDDGIIDTRILVSVVEHRGRHALLCVAHDITDRLRYEASLIDQHGQMAEHARELEAAHAMAERAKTAAEMANAAKSQFLAVMSHELRTPLNSILGFSEIIRGDGITPMGLEKHREYAGLIHDSGRHLLRLINNILDLSKIEAGKMDLNLSRVTAEQIVAAACQDMAFPLTKKNHALSVEVEDDLPPFYADRQALTQCITNILSNAIKFTDPGGQIRLAARLVEGEIEMSVADTGCGIPADALERVTHPFEQVEKAYVRSTQGSGIGLALVKSLVEMHHGSVTIDSAPGVGTTVRLRLPIGSEQTIPLKKPG